MCLEVVLNVRAGAAVVLTAEGWEAGKEILRQHADGRYSLAFEGLS